MNAQLQKYLESVKEEVSQISNERKEVLKQLASFTIEALSSTGQADFIFICTHNSRRSHLPQVMAQVVAHYYGIKNVNCYSGGTEATAMFHSSAKALENAGLEVLKLSEETNSVYSLKYDENQPAVIGFSKAYGHKFNVQNGFAAIMTCNHADANCPIIPNAAQRISLPYIDPKEFDGTPQQQEKYDERRRDITREMLYAFSLV